MSATTLLTLFYPLSQKMPKELVAQALSVADDNRPKCLSDDKQDEAVAWYAAYLLAQSIESGVNATGLKREREGDLEREYFSGSDKGGNAERFLAKYNALNDVCLRLGSITVGCNYV
ncbi:DUF4054 domain-containing protein [Rodentibacter caecimuris]|uniref:DUF4054 domain-containing protein n=1 Tax=Rodentibacter caecimuris TaxID=1796644 RepID=UPI00211A14F3|nr:DUF4054 domain-containing protein [Rodentibacter heylii]MCQ9124356.1 DUF4054 domain-containing protein [Rodentibacter heylii]